GDGSSPSAGTPLPQPARRERRTRRRSARARRGDWGGYCLRYGLPSAAGGMVRPITPATAISVRTYGSTLNRVDADGEYTCNLNATALEKPNRIAAPNAPAGRQFPKMSAASAMKPRPSVMLLMKVPPPKPSER